MKTECRPQTVFSLALYVALCVALCVALYVAFFVESTFYATNVAKEQICFVLFGLFVGILN